MGTNMARSSVRIFLLVAALASTAQPESFKSGLTGSEHWSEIPFTDHVPAALFDAGRDPMECPEAAMSGNTELCLEVNEDGEAFFGSLFTEMV